jgi:hypothetical protein
LNGTGRWSGRARRTAAYQEAFARLRAAWHGVWLRLHAQGNGRFLLARDGTRRYPGTCRTGLPPGRAARAWRLRVEPGVVAFEDAVQGHVEEDLAADVGDFVLLRADGLFAYQLAVVVDDAEAGVTEVVRGADLLDSTARQIVLQRLLGYPTPAYAHLPVASNAAGEKLSKQTLARAVESAEPAGVLVDALDFLGQGPPGGLAGIRSRGGMGVGAAKLGDGAGAAPARGAGAALRLNSRGLPPFIHCCRISLKGGEDLDARQFARGGAQDGFCRRGEEVFGGHVKVAAQPGSCPDEGDDPWRRTRRRFRPGFCSS